MSETIPPIPPPFGTSSGDPGSLNVNRVDMMPTTTDSINTSTTTNVSQSVVDENPLNFLIQEEEDEPSVPMSSLSTFENHLPKRQNQWSNAESRLANQDKRLKSIIISCLPNDVMKSVIKCKTTKEIWNDLILAHEGPSDIRDTKIAALRLKFNAFKSLEDSDSDVEEDQRTNNEFMANLNAEYHERALLANQERFYKSQLILKQHFNGQCTRSGRASWINDGINVTLFDVIKYGKSNGPLIYQLQRELNNVSQENLSVAANFNKLKKCWDELHNLNGVLICSCDKMQECTCNLVDKFLEIKGRSKLVQFFMKLNDDYESVRNQILSMDPLPNVNKAYYIVQQVEKQKQVTNHVADPMAFFANMYQNMFVKKDTKGYQDWYKGKKNKKGGKLDDNVVFGPETPFDMGYENELQGEHSNLGLDQKLVAALAWKTPFEILHGTPSYEALKTIGCLCYAASLGPNRDKFDPKGIRCVLIGYPPGQKGCKLYNLSTHEVIHSRDVVFQESVFPFKEPVTTFAPSTVIPVCYPDLSTSKEVDVPEAPTTTPFQIRLLNPFAPLKIIVHQNISVVLIYVDDVLVTADSIHEIAQVKEALDQKFTIKDMREAKHFLGIEVCTINTGTHLNQRKYILDLLQDSGLTTYKPNPSHLPTSLHLSLDKVTPLTDDAVYRRLVRRLLYLTMTRPSISYVVQHLSQFVSAPKDTHMQAALYLLRYIKGTISKGLFYLVQSQLRVTGFWANCLMTRRSLPVIVFFLVIP
nr:hypothetical protein [Tanacetum cinerariifolium]